MKATTMPKTYHNTKTDFLWLKRRYWLPFQAPTGLEKVRFWEGKVREGKILPPNLSESHNSGLRYK